MTEGNTLHSEPLAFELRAGPYVSGELAVASFEGREGLSKLFRFDVSFLTELDTPSLKSDLLGKPAELSLAVPGRGPRRIRGITSSVTCEGTRDDQGNSRYRLRLVPRAWLLRRRRNTRIFQDITVEEVVSRVLGEHRIRMLWRALRRYPKRSYCVQYQETDHDFVARLLAEEGLFFYFEPPPEPAPWGDHHEVLVVGDSAEAYVPIADTAPGGAASPSGRAPVIVFRPHEGMLASDEHVFSFQDRAAVKPESVCHRDYDFERPRLDFTVSTRDPGAESLRGGAPPGGPPPGGLADLEVYEHHGEHSDVDEAHERAEVRLEQLRRRAATASGAGTCRRLAAGHCFRLEGHPEAHLDGDYAITSVLHEGTSPGSEGPGGRPGERSYTCRFECLPANLPYRPPPPKRRMVRSIESAVVVGPDQETIHTDAYGRIKVQFHWDREGRRDERSSCWIRVAQVWAGAGWGFQFIPRVGMEVLVSFLGGDPDRPVVVGCLSNRINMPPFPLPFEKTRSGIKTSSGGGGYNELSFEDAAGHEQIRVHAGRDLEETVGRDRTRVVQGDESVSVAGDRRSTVSGDLGASVAGTRSATIGEDDLLMVSGRSSVHHGGDTEIETGGAFHQVVHGASTTRLQGPALTEAADDLTTQVEGNHRLTVGVDGTGNTSTTFVFGDIHLSATSQITLRADEEITLICGATTLRLTPSKLEALTKTLHLLASDESFLAGNKQSLHLQEGAEIVAETVTLFSSGASLELTDSEARLGGSKVKLGKPASAPEREGDAPPDPEKKTVRWRFTDAGNRPYASKKYHLLVEGLRFEGQTDGDGLLTAEIPREAHGAEVILWIGEYPTGERRRYPIVIVDELPDPATPAGARARLHALGYDVGLHSADPWPAMRRAVHLFQTEHGSSDGLTATGELDEATMQAVQRVFGG